MIASIGLGGQQSQSIMDKGQTIGDSQTGYNAFNDAATKGGVTTESFYLIVENPTGHLDTDAGRGAVADMAARLTALTASVDSRQVPVFYTDPRSQLPAVVDPFVLARMAPDQATSVLSAHGTTALITARVSGDDSEATAKIDAIKPLADQFKRDYPSLTIYAFNSRLINADFGNYVNSSLDGLLLPTLLITFFILLVASRSAIAAFVPIVLALSAIIGAMGLVGLYSQGISPVSQYVAQIVVLIGLAVAVDYSLFVISRFRTERSAGRDKFGAIEVASSTAGRAVFFSGLAVMISLGGLLLINDDVFKSIAIGSIAVVLISVFGSLTFLPAVLSILDRKLMRFGVPFLSRDRGEGKGILGHRRPRCHEQGRGCGGRRGRDPHPDRLTRFQAPAGLDHERRVDAAAQRRGRPSLGPHHHQVAGRPEPDDGRHRHQRPRPQDRAAIATFEAAEKSGRIPGVNAATAAVDVSGDGTVVDIHAGIPGTANDVSNWNLARTFRASVVPAYFGSLGGSRVYVSGDAAYTMDYAGWYGGQMPLVIVFVLGMKFLLLLVAFHSIVIAIKAIILNLLSAGAAFGVLVLLFQEGWLKDLTGIRLNVIEAWAPAMIFTILFGLSMDDHVFILTRVKEARDRGLASTDAVVKGITITAGTVTSAAAIMVCVFGAFFTIQLAIMQQLGVGLAVAILADATLVRSLLFPSLMKLLGEWNWWMPGFLRWIPRITIEGEPEALLGAARSNPEASAAGA